MYNAPRSASIKSDDNSVLFMLDRDTFNHIVKSASMKKREKFDEFLSKLEILQDLNPYERERLCDVLTEEEFEDGVVVMREGDPGDRLYFILDGCADTYKKNAKGKDELVFKFNTNDYFGELALLKNAPRAATVVSRGRLKVCSIDRDSFKRMLGPLELLLSRNIERYERFIKNMEIEDNITKKSQISF